MPARLGWQDQPSCCRYPMAQVQPQGGEERPLQALNQSRPHLQQLPPASLKGAREGHLIRPHMRQLPPGSVGERQEGLRLPLLTLPVGSGWPREGRRSLLQPEQALPVCRGQRQSQRQPVPGVRQACRQTLQSTR